MVYMTNYLDRSLQGKMSEQIRRGVVFGVKSAFEINHGKSAHNGGNQLHILLDQ